ncbi:unnamed protein product, partial [Notodromas monacha]
MLQINFGLCDACVGFRGIDNRLQRNARNIPRKSEQKTRVGSGGAKMFLKKLFLLLWKNWLIRWRHPVLFFVEIIAVALFFGLLLIVKIQLASSSGDVLGSDTEIFAPSLERGILGALTGTWTEPPVIMYAPNNTETREIMENVLEMIVPSTREAGPLETRAFASEKELLRAVDSLGLISGFLSLRGAIVFTSTTGNSFSYKVRIKNFQIPTEFLFSPVSLPGAGDTYWNYDSYVAPLQLVIRTQAFPYPAYSAALQDFLSFLFGLMLPQFTVFGFLFLVPIIHLGVVKEKQTGVKELMKMMGMSRVLYWSSWLLSCIVSLIIPITIAIIICVAPISSDGAIYGHSDGLLIAIFYILFALSFISFSFFVTTFFDRRVGLQWKNMNQAPYLNDGMTMTSVFLMLVFDTVFYMILTLYMDTIKPGKYGVPAPIYFPFQLSYWFPKKSKVNAKSDSASASILAGKNQFFEEEPQHLQAGIDIANLRKVFWSLEGKKVAVDGLSLKAYRSQITALLGHNGAGKTTTMSILTGLYSPSGGTAVIDGYDITTSLDKVRERMGLCPQHSMLFPEITVMEHLLLFGQ